MEGAFDMRQSNLADRKAMVWRMFLGILPAVLAYMSGTFLIWAFWPPKLRVRTLGDVLGLLLQQSLRESFLTVMPLFFLTSLVSALCLFFGRGRRIAATSAAITALFFFWVGFIQDIDRSHFFASFGERLHSDLADPLTFVEWLCLPLYHALLSFWLLSASGRRAFQQKSSVSL